MKNISIKQEFFEKVKNVYGLTSMKLITRWLSHGKVAQRVLGCCEVLVALLDIAKKSGGARYIGWLYT